MYPLIPDARVELALASTATGLVLEPSKFRPDDFRKYVGVAGFDLTDLLLEYNTSSVILLPKAFPKDVSTSLFTCTGGNWERVPNRAAGATGLMQTDSDAGVTYSAVSNSTSWIRKGGGFTLKMNLGPCLGTMTQAQRTAAEVYRRITWPANAPAGKNRYQLVMGYRETPLVRKSTDGGVTYQRVGDLHSPLDMEKLTTFDNVETSFTALELITGEVIFWLGQGRQRFALVDYDAAGWEDGTLQVEGKNGVIHFGYSDLYFKATGTLDSIEGDGPRNVKTALPERHVRGTLDAAKGHAASAEILRSSIDEKTKRYRYRLTVSSDPVTLDPASPLFGYSASTPVVKGVNVLWPGATMPPVETYWEPLEGLVSVDELHRRDPRSRVRTSWFNIEASNTFGEWMKNPGLQAVRVYLGWKHSGLRLRGTMLANVRGDFPTRGPLARFNTQCQDVLFMAQGKPLLDNLNPSKWCVYALKRLLWEHAGVVPELMLNIPQCPYGHDPGCSHTKMPPHHPGWRILKLVTECMAEVMKAEFGKTGPSPEGQVLFDRYDPDDPYLVKKSFYESPQNLADPDEILAHSGGLRRIFSQDDTRNDFTILGFGREAGRPFAKHRQDEASLFDRFAANYKGFIAPFIDVWSGYQEEDFAEEMLDRYYRWLRRPQETALLPCYGQPDLFPDDVVNPQEGRSVGYGSEYVIEEIRSVYRKPGFYQSNLHLRWVGGALPGTA